MANPKVTVIGAPAALSPLAADPGNGADGASVTAPTLIGGLGGLTAGSTPSLQHQPSKVMPTAMSVQAKPVEVTSSSPAPQSVTPPTQPVSPTAVGMVPTTLKGSAPRVPASVATPLSASTATLAPVAPFEPLRPMALSGVQRKPLQVSSEELAQCFPQHSQEDRHKAQGVLSGFSMASANATVVLSFGKGPQELLSTIARDRLAFAQRPGVRYTLQHLSRLQNLLQDVLDAFAGGFLRKSPEKVWQNHNEEIQQIERLLDEADDKLAADLGELGTMKARCEDCKQELAGAAMAADYLKDRLPQDLASLMLSRLGSITASQALVLEQLLQIDQDSERLQELTLLVQDGVVLKLPAVYAQLTALGGRINDTERFRAMERLNDILNPLKARQPS